MRQVRLVTNPSSCRRLRLLVLCLRRGWVAASGFWFEDGHGRRIQHELVFPDGELLPRIVLTKQCRPLYLAVEEDADVLPTIDAYLDGQWHGRKRRCQHRLLRRLFDQLVDLIQFFHLVRVYLEPGFLHTGSVFVRKCAQTVCIRCFDPEPPRHRRRTPGPPSLWYLPPEELLGVALADGVAADLWALGCILGELHSGKPLFQGVDAADVLLHIVRLLGRPSGYDFTYLPRELFRMLRFPPVDVRDVRRHIPCLNEQDAALLYGLLAYRPALRNTRGRSVCMPLGDEIEDVSDDDDTPVVEVPEATTLVEITLHELANTDVCPHASSSSSRTTFVELEWDGQRLPCPRSIAHRRVEHTWTVALREGLMKRARAGRVRARLTGYCQSMVAMARRARKQRCWSVDVSLQPLFWEAMGGESDGWLTLEPKGRGQARVSVSVQRAKPLFLHDDDVQEEKDDAVGDSRSEFFERYLAEHVYDTADDKKKKPSFAAVYAQLDELAEQLQAIMK